MFADILYIKHTFSHMIYIDPFINYGDYIYYTNNKYNIYFNTLNLNENNILYGWYDCIQYKIYCILYTIYPSAPIQSSRHLFHTMFMNQYYYKEFNWISDIYPITDMSLYINSYYDEVYTRLGYIRIKTRGNIGRTWFWLNKHGLNYLQGQPWFIQLFFLPFFLISVVENYLIHKIYLLTNIEYFRNTNSLFISIFTSKLMMYNFFYHGTLYSKIHNCDFNAIKMYWYLRWFLPTFKNLESNYFYYSFLNTNRITINWVFLDKSLLNKFSLNLFIFFFFYLRLK